MRSGITRQALRRHRWSLLGPAVTQAAAAAVVAMMVMTATSLDAAGLAPAERAAVEASSVPESTLVFTLIGVYMSVVLVGVTMNLTIAIQIRDIALLRAIGATPGRIRRSVALQAAIVAVPSAALGYLAGIVAGYAWISAMRAHDVLPPAVTFRAELWVLPMVIGIEIATSVAGALVAAIRPARIRPALALTESATRRPGVGAVRVAAGLVLVIGGLVLSAVIGRFSPEDAAESAFFVLLAMCVGVGVLGPVLLRTVVAVARPLTASVPVRSLRPLVDGPARLAIDNVGATSRALSGALVPLVLVIAFAAVKVATHTTPAHRSGVVEPAGELWTDYTGTAVYCVFAAIAALNTLVTLLVGRRRDLAVAQLAGGTRRRVLAVVVCEAVLVTVTALGLAAGIAIATLLPILRTAPYVPPAYLGAGALLAAAVVAAGMVVPAAVLTRRRPITVVAAAME